MATLANAEPKPTENVPPPFWGRNLFAGDPLLKLHLDDLLGGRAEAELTRVGAFYGSAEANDYARLAERYPPALRTHDANGRRLDLVEYHPACHALMRRGAEFGLHASLWEDSPAESGHRNALRAGRLFLAAEVEAGHLAALTMTSAAIAALARAPAQLETWMPLLVRRGHDHRFLPAAEKRGATFGLGISERAGGSELRANATVAERAGDGSYRLTGQKWFLSAPMADAFLMLAQTVEGLTLFLVPRFLPDGSVNAIHFHRLKPKLGNHSNASVEAELVRAAGWAIGEPGRGGRTTVELTTLTRIDAATISAGLMRAAASQAVHHARHRAAFGSPLADKPLMQRVLADMALDVAAATVLVQRLAHSLDSAPGDSNAAAFARVMTPAIKYWVAKTAPMLAAEAIECMGGNGYVEDFDLARLYREVPANTIWGGAGNVLALDLAAMIRADPAVLDPVIDAIRDDLGEPGVAAADVLRSAARAAMENEGSARILAEQLAITCAAATLRRQVPRALADAFVDSRMGGTWRSTYGMLDARFDSAGIVDFLYPEE